MYEISNLVNLDINTISQDSSVNFGNITSVGGTTNASSVGGSEAIGDYSNNFDAEQNYLYSNTAPQNIQPIMNPSKTRQVKEKIVNIIKDKRNKSYINRKKKD